MTLLLLFPVFIISMLAFALTVVLGRPRWGVSPLMTETVFKTHLHEISDTMLFIDNASGYYSKTFPFVVYSSRERGWWPISSPGYHIVRARFNELEA